MGDPPPDVYTTSDDVWFRARTPDGPVVVTVRMEHPLGTIAPEGRTGGYSWDRGSVARWSLDRHDDDSEPSGPDGQSLDQGRRGGPIAIDGRLGLTAIEVEAWRRATLVVNFERCEEARIERPSDPVPPEIIVRLESREPIATFVGRVLDERGRPLRSAGVFLHGASLWSSAKDEPGVRTAGDGTFVLAASVEAPPDDDEPHPLTLVVVAPGFAAAAVPVHLGGEEGLDVSLAPEAVDGSLDVLLLAPDGRPAVGARAFLHAVGSAFVATNGLPIGPEEDARSPDRRRLARLLGDAALEAQGFGVGQDCNPIDDLLADDNGHLRVPALPAGRYHLHAVLPARPDGLAGRAVDFGALRLGASVEAEIEVIRPPVRTEATVRFSTGRVIEGRIVVAVNPAWHCGKDRHHHFVRPHEWPWTGVEVESGAGRTGRFRLEGMPPGGFTLHVWTVDHGEVRTEIPWARRDMTVISERSSAYPGGTEILVSAGDTGSTTDVGDVVVPDVRVVFGKVVGADGGRPLSFSWLGPVELRGAGAAETTYLCSDGTFRIALRTPPEPGAVLVVGSDEAHPDVVRVPWPFDLGDAEHPLVVRLPKDVPAAEKASDAPVHDDVPASER